MTLADLLAAFAKRGTPTRTRKPVNWWTRWRADAARTPAAFLDRDAAQLRRRDIEALRDAVIAAGYCSNSVS